jgi:hypothetical protein
MMEKEMYATSDDWSFDKVPSNFGDKNSEFTDELKDMGAINFFWVQTSQTSGRSITIWPDQATGQAALYRIREGASANTGMQIAGVCEGNVIASMYW